MPRWPQRTLEMRFWTKVFIPGHGFITDPGDVPALRKKYWNVCWEWRGGHHERGYGHFRIRPGPTGVVRSNRLSLELTGQKMPDDKPYSLHHCDNPPCCHPDHLYWGDQPENMDDVRRRFRTHPKRIDLHGEQQDLIANG